VNQPEILISTDETTIKKQTRRIDSLDWLRGLMALSIMSYHLCFWYFFTPDASTFIGRMGIYGVSIFFVLSGLSMAIVYNHFISSVYSGFAFLIRRIFRIWPLLGIATIATIFISRNQPPDLATILLNLTGFFGFVPPFRNIATGAWSIGNEMVYYVLTPFILWAYNYKKWVGNLIVLLTSCITLYFAFVQLTPTETLVQQWGTYIHPMNNLFLYAAGIAIYYNLREAKFNPFFNSAILIGCVLLLLFYPVSGNQILIVTGFNRIAFVLTSIGLVVGFYKFSFTIPRVVSYPLEKLGIVTYGVYILHPIVNHYVGTYFPQIEDYNHFQISCLVIAFTIIYALILYYTLELPLMKLGKRLTSKA